MDSDGYGFVRLGWDVLDEENVFKDTTKKELKQIKKNVKLYNKLIKFCIRHFEDYKPDPWYSISAIYKSINCP